MINKKIAELKALMCKDSPSWFIDGFHLDDFILQGFNPE
jgi:hypothetical protein